MHLPVLLSQVVEFLEVKAGDFIVDGTVNGGGHAAELLKQVGSAGRVLGVDLDAARIENLFKNPKFQKKNFIGVCGNYADIPNILAERKLPKADGLLLDLGFSSEQLDGGGRGFSFLKDEPLVMTYGSETSPAYEVIAGLSETDLADVIFQYGGERYSRRIARAIREHRGVRTSGQLADIIAKSLPRGYERGRIHPATRTFQALRIFVNDELGNLKKILGALPYLLKPGARVVIISFHSLEDKIVKEAFRTMQKEGVLEIITKKPVGATREEAQENPRSRSAKVRAARMGKG